MRRISYEARQAVEIALMNEALAAGEGADLSLVDLKRNPKADHEWCRRLARAGGPAWARLR
jgi:hypothetical protein